jgi:c-di-GMP-binding flagellar brake protein YcgR
VPEGQFYMERRKHIRADKNMNVSFRVMPKEETEKEAFNAAKRYVNSVDISITGMQLICDDNIEIDKVIRMDVVLDKAAPPLATFAEVKWSRRDDKLNKYRIGIEFLVIKEDHIEAIKKITGEV